MDSEKSVYLDREEHFHRGSIGGKIVIPYYYDAATDTASPASSSTTPTVYKTMYDFDAAGTYIYTGEAAPGTATSAPSWRISKVNLDASSGNPTSKLWADGVSTFTKVWDNHASYGYTA